MIQLRQATELDPDNPEMLIYLASVLAADENPRFRDGKEALELAKKAVMVTDSQQPAAFDALAMSNAEKGDFAAAALNSNAGDQSGQNHRASGRPGVNATAIGALPAASALAGIFPGKLRPRANLVLLLL